MDKDNTYSAGRLRSLGTITTLCLLIVSSMTIQQGCKTKSVLVAEDTLLGQRTASPSPYGTYDDKGNLTDIDVTGIFENCETIYFGINIHWYLEDKCAGTIDLNNEKGIDREEVWARSRKMIDGLNYMYDRLGENEQYRRRDTEIYSEPHCVPIRMVLDDVIIHCASEPRETRVSFREFYDYVVDGDSIMNIFMSIVKTSVSGFAGGKGHMITIEETNVATLCHEFGHNFGLSHAYQNERSNVHTKEKCLDVYLAPAIAWDGDGDGKLDSNKPKGNCWDQKPGGDKNKNDVGDYCEGIYKDNPHPCCSWARQDNNLMISSAWAKNPEYAAISSCQTRYMLDHIQGRKVKYIEQLGGCPPPRAVIGRAPASPGERASPIIHLEASSNAAKHQVVLYDRDHQIVMRTSTLDHPPRPIDISRIDGIPTASIDSILLIVQNDCGQTHTRGLHLGSKEM